MATAAAVFAGLFQCLGRTRYGGAPAGIDHCWHQGLGPPLVARVSADPESRARPGTPRSCVNRWVKWTPLTTAGTPSPRARGLEPAPQTVDLGHGPLACPQRRRAVVPTCMARSHTGPRRSSTSPSIRWHDCASGPTVRAGHAVLVLMASLSSAANPSAHGHVIHDKHAARLWTAHAQAAGEPCSETRHNPWGDLSYCDRLGKTRR